MTIVTHAQLLVTEARSALQELQTSVTQTETAIVDAWRWLDEQQRIRNQRRLLCCKTHPTKQ